VLCCAGAPATVSVLMALAGAAAAALAVGYQTWWATLACWVHWRSAEVRAGPVHQVGGPCSFTLTLPQGTSPKRRHRGLLCMSLSVGSSLRQLALKGMK
jgi:hypothetical protein